MTKLQQVYVILIDSGIDEQRMSLVSAHHMILNDHHIIDYGDTVVIDNMYRVEVDFKYMYNAAGNIWRLCK